MKHILFWFFLALAAGILLAGFVGARPAVWLGFGSVSALAALLAGDRPRVFLSFLVLAALCLGAFARAASPLPLRSAAWEALVAKSGEGAVLEGTVERDLETKPTPYGKTSVRFVIAKLGLPGKARVHLVADRDPGLQYGARVRVRGAFERPAEQRNPAGFDERRYLESTGVFAILRGKSFEVLSVPAAPGVLDRLRNHWNARYRTMWRGGHLEIARALFLGERSGLDAELRSQLVRTGTMHYFAISGSNMTLLAGVILALFAFARLGNVPRNLLTLAVLIAYAAMVGGSPPVVRALVMAAAFLCTRLLTRQFHALNALGLAGAVILLVHPEDLGDAGFQLSFAAVTALVAFAPRFWGIADVRRARLGNAAGRAAVALKALVVASVVAWAVTAPVSWTTFHTVFLLSPLANLVLAPVVLLLNILLVAASGAALLPPGLDRLIAAPAGLVIDAMTAIVGFFAGFDAFFVSGGGWAWLTLAGAGAVTAAVAAKKVFTRPATALAALFLAVSCGILGDASLVWANRLPRVTFFDVGQGDGIFFEFGKRGNLLVDTGPGSDEGAEYVIGPYLRSRGIRRIDAVVVTHPQADHCGALEALARDFRVGVVIDNGDKNGADFYRSLEAALARKKITRLEVGAGDRITGYPAHASVRVLHPPKRGYTPEDLNDASVVMRVHSAGRTFLLTGDIGEDGVSVLRAGGPVEHAAVYKVPHHGARMGRESLELLRDVRPALAVIQAGRRNRYGHPHPETLENLAALAREVKRTDLGGSVLLEREW